MYRFRFLIILLYFLLFVTGRSWLLASSKSNHSHKLACMGLVPSRTSNWMKTKAHFNGFNHYFFLISDKQTHFSSVIQNLLMWITYEFSSFTVHNQRVSDISFLWYTHPLLVDLWSQNHDKNPVTNSNLTQLKSTSKSHGYRNGLLYLLIHQDLKNEKRRSFHKHKIKY